MTEPLSPEEIVKPWSTAMISWLRLSSPEHLEPAMLGQLADLAEDHARLVAENAKMRERVEKLEAAGATVLRGFDEGAFVRNVRGDHDPAWAIKLLPYLAALAALAACDEEEGS